MQRVFIPGNPPSSAKLDLILAISGGLLLGASFPPSPFYSLAYVAFVPVFFLLERAQSYGHFARYSYVFLLVFHLVTVYWTGGYTQLKDGWLVTSNLALLTLHPFFYFPSILLALFVRRKLGMVFGLISFALLWVSYEYLHSLGEFSFPWMTVGNSQAYDLTRIQIAEYTSSYGVSLLVLVFNIIAYILLSKLLANEWHPTSRNSILAFGLLLVVNLAPWFYGHTRMQPAQEVSKPVRIAIVQPNFDPWEKWGEGFSTKWQSYASQLQTYISETKTFAGSDPDLILWPETAIPFEIVLPRFSEYLSEVTQLVDSVRAPLLTGFPYAEFSDSTKASVTAQRLGNSGVFVESYNAAILIQPGHRLGPVYKKIVLVPFAERIPYAKTLKFLIEPLKWRVGISSWGMGKDTVVFRFSTRKGEVVTFSGMVCYESVYPDFVRQFVSRGAQFLVVLTNDSWWGNTSGVYQHAAYASFRAIENRRWVVQCSNGGISEYVDPYGRAHISTKMFSAVRWIDEIDVGRLGTTFYTRHGDIFAQVCLFCSGVFVILALFRTSKKT